MRIPGRIIGQIASVGLLVYLSSIFYSTTGVAEPENTAPQAEPVHASKHPDVQVSQAPIAHGFYPDSPLDGTVAIYSAISEAPNPEAVKLVCMAFDNKTQNKFAQSWGTQTCGQAVAKLGDMINIDKNTFANPEFPSGTKSSKGSNSTIYNVNTCSLEFGSGFGSKPATNVKPELGTLTWTQLDNDQGWIISGYIKNNCE